MQIRIPTAFLLLPLGAGAVSCDSVTIGQGSEDSGPPVLRKILVQDETPRGGRRIATDLLDKRAPVPCSDKDPCPVNNQYEYPSLSGSTCIIPDGQTDGTCLDPLSPTSTPPAVGVVTGRDGSVAGNQIRLVWSKVLSGAFETVTTDEKSGQVIGAALSDPTAVEIDDASGKAIDSVIYWDPGGSPDVTADPFIDPYGPAVVIKPKTAFVPATQYCVKLDPAKLKDKSGQNPVADINGPVGAQGFRYCFVTEAFYVAGTPNSIVGGPTASLDNSAVLAPTDVLSVPLSASADPQKLSVKVTLGGAPVDVYSWFDVGADATACAENLQQLNIFPLVAGCAGKWAAGSYSLELGLAAAGNDKAALTTDAFGTTPWPKTSFSVDEKATSTNDISTYVLPGSCSVPDGGVPAGPVCGADTDGGTLADGGTATDDAGATSDAAANSDAAASSDAAAPTDAGATDDLAAATDGGVVNPDMAAPADGAGVRDGAP